MAQYRNLALTAMAAAFAWMVIPVLALAQEESGQSNWDHSLGFEGERTEDWPTNEEGDFVKIRPAPAARQLMPDLTKKDSGQLKITCFTGGACADPADWCGPSIESPCQPFPHGHCSEIECQDGGCCPSGTSCGAPGSPTCSSVDEDVGFCTISPTRSSSWPLLLLLTVLGLIGARGARWGQVLI